MIKLPPAEVHVWYFKRMTHEEIQSLMRSLSPEELTELAGITDARPGFPAGRSAEFAVSRGGMRTLASLYSGLSPLDVRVQVLKRGKPVILPFGGYSGTDGSLDINGSHTDGYHVFAAAREAVGIDLEKIRTVRRFEAVMDFSYTRDEAEWVRSAGGDEEKTKRFYRLWCLKEAAVKALGLDMMVNGRDALFNPEDLAASVEDAVCDGTADCRIIPAGACRIAYPAGDGVPPGESLLCCVELSIFPGYSCALCYTGDAKTVRFKGDLSMMS